VLTWTAAGNGAAGECVQGAPGELPAAVPHLQQLDLTDNLIGSWSTVISICQELPQLQLINLTHNKLNLPSSFNCCQQQLLPGLQCLVLNQCGITWPQVHLRFRGTAKCFVPVD